MSGADLEVATALAGLIAQVVNGTLTREAEVRRHKGLLLLSQVGRAISAEESLPVLLPRLARIVREVSKVLGVVVALFDESLSEFEVAAIAGPTGMYGQGFRFPGRPHRSCLSPRVMRSGRPLRLDDLRKTPGVCVYWPEVRSTLVLPIRSQGKILGTLRLEGAQRRAFDEEDARLYATVADQIGHAVRRARVLETLARKQSGLRAVSEGLEKRLEEERRRIARELHDELAQSMTAAKINLGLLRNLTRGAAPEVRRAIKETEAVVLHTIFETRRIAMDLRPAILDELGLVPALRWYADTFARRTGVAVDVRTNGGGRSLKQIATLLFRFFQEALTNVALHARARHVRIGLNASNGTLRAVVQDDGIGMKPYDASRQGQGLGLLGMRERIERAGGVLRIRSRQGRGTRLVAEIPMRHGERGRSLARQATGSETFEGGFS
jgi:signal transduction histidine kinase